MHPPAHTQPATHHNTTLSAYFTVQIPSAQPHTHSEESERQRGGQHRKGKEGERKEENKRNARKQIGILQVCEEQEGEIDSERAFLHLFKMSRHVNHRATQGTHTITQIPTRTHTTSKRTRARNATCHAGFTQLFPLICPQPLKFIYGKLLQVFLKVITDQGPCRFPQKCQEKVPCHLRPGVETVFFTHITLCCFYPPYLPHSAARSNGGEQRCCRVVCYAR